MKFAILFFMCMSSIASAETWYVVPDSADKNKQVVVGATGFIPTGAIAVAPTDSEGNPIPAEALDFIDQPSGDFSKIAIINQARLSAKIEADKKAKDDEIAAVKTERQAAKLVLRRCLLATPTAAESRQCLALVIRRLMQDVDIDEPALRARAVKRKATR